MATILGKSDATVRNQLHGIFRKLRVRSRTAALGRLKDSEVSS
ncbi:MAG: response regulator transcription factor [Deltaproteobacteria bacterium]|nr:response regulator transcription factor [Deltaproteobacteria bacterium]